MRQSHLRTAVISPWGLPLCFVTSLEIFISRILISPCHTGKDSEMIKGMNSRDFCATEALLHFTASSVTGSAWLGSESPVPLWKSLLRSLDTQPFLGSAEPILSLPDLRLGLSTSVFSTFRFWRNWWWGHCWHFLFPFPWSLRDLKQKKKPLNYFFLYLESPIHSMLWYKSFSGKSSEVLSKSVWKTQTLQISHSPENMLILPKCLSFMWLIAVQSPDT